MQSPKYKTPEELAASARRAREYSDAIALDDRDKEYFNRLYKLISVYNHRAFHVVNSPDYGYAQTYLDDLKRSEYVILQTFLQYLCEEYNLIAREMVDLFYSVFSIGYGKLINMKKVRARIETALIDAKAERYQKNSANNNNK